MTSPAFGALELSSWVLRTLIESSCLVLLALLLERSLLRRCAAGLRHGPWLLVFARLLVPPLPHGSVPGAGWTEGLAAPSEAAARWLALEVASPSALPLSLCIVWAAVAGSLLLRLLRRARATRRVLLASSRPAPRHVLSRARAIARAAGLARAPRVRVHDGPAPALVLGLRRPVILLASGLGTSSREAALWHECMHLARRDPWLQAGLEVVHALWWFHPLLALAKARAASARELACDLAVVRAWPGGAGRYRGVLLAEAARRLSTSSRPAVPVSASTLTWLRGPALLRERLEALERTASSRRTRAARSAVAALAGLSLLAACGGSSRAATPVPVGWWHDANLARAELEAWRERRAGAGCAQGRSIFLRALALEQGRATSNP